MGKEFSRIAACLAFFLTLPLYAAPRRVILLHTNDLHGHFYGKLEAGRRPHNGYALENLVAHAEATRVEAGKDADVIVTFGGDLNTGTPESALFRAAPDMELLRLAGLQVAVIGNHEFDNAPEVFEKQIRDAGFPWISANVERRSGGLLVAPYHIIQAGGIKIGFIGLTTEQTEKIGNPQFIKPYAFKPALAAARGYLPELRGKTDFIIALTHLGFYKKGEVPFAATDDRLLAEEAADVNLILGGHSHSLVNAENVNGTRIFQAKCFGAFLVRVDLEVEPRSAQGRAKYRFVESRTIDLRNPPERMAETVLTKRRRAQKITEEYLAQSEKKFGETIAEAADDFHYEREHVLASPVTRLVVESQLAESKADIALLIAGGIRGGFKKGKITLRDVLTVLPFDNTVGIVEMQGKELAELLRVHILQSTDMGSYPVAAGIDISVDSEKKILRIQKDGKPFDLDRTYKVAFNSYVASGGSGYPDYFAKGRFNDLGQTDAMLLAAYLRKKGRISRAALR